MAAVVLPATVWLMPNSLTLRIVTSALGLLAIFKHRSNIQRLIRGTEGRVGLRAKELQNENHCTRRRHMGNGLAKVLHENGNGVTLWDIDTVLLDEIRRGHSECYLPGVILPANWKVEVDFGKAVGGAECVVLAVPSNVFRQVAVKLKSYPAILVSATKGIEFETGETMSRILCEQAPANRVAVLSGRASRGKSHWVFRPWWFAPVKTMA